MGATSARMCRLCGRGETETVFYVRGTGGAKVGRLCRPCNVAKTKLWRTSDAYQRGRAKRHQREAMITFGLTADQYDTLYRDPRCAGCGVQESGKGTRLSIDHDHVTGKVRGLLCHDCNLTVGTAHDRPAILRNLAGYLERNDLNDLLRAS
jgi:hypothetical protein